jgi:hypothetical protein
MSAELARPSDECEHDEDAQDRHDSDNHDGDLAHGSPTRWSARARQQRDHDTYHGDRTESDVRHASPSVHDAGNDKVKLRTATCSTQS